MWKQHILTFTESQKKNSVECHDTNPQIKLKVSHTEMSSSCWCSEDKCLIWEV